MIKQLKKLVLSGAFLASIFLAFLSYKINNAQSSNTLDAILGPSIAEGTACGVVITCANGTGSGTSTATASGTASGTSTATASGTSTATASGTSSATGSGTGGVSYAAPDDF